MDFSFLLNLFKLKNACEASNIQFINLIVKSAYLNFVGNIPKSHFTPPATKITWRKISIPIEMVKKNIYIYIYMFLKLDMAYYSTYKQWNFKHKDVYLGERVIYFMKNKEKLS